MARKRRSGRPDPRHARPATPGPRWQWRTAPVWLALTGGFILGWYTYLFGARTTPNTTALIVFYVVMFGFTLGLSRVTSRLMERWLVRRRAAGRERAEAQARDRREQSPSTTERPVRPAKGP